MTNMQIKQSTQFLAHIFLWIVFPLICGELNLPQIITWPNRMNHEYITFTLTHLEHTFIQSDKQKRNSPNLILYYKNECQFMSHFNK